MPFLKDPFTGESYFASASDAQALAMSLGAAAFFPITASDLLAAPSAANIARGDSALFYVPSAPEVLYRINAGRTGYAGVGGVSGAGNRLLRRPRRPRTVHPSPPTISYSLSAPTTMRSTLPWKDAANLTGTVVAFNDSSNALDIVAGGAFNGVDTILTGTVISFCWKTQIATAERVMVYVDGLPCMSLPATPSISTSTGAYCWLTLTFGAAQKGCRVEILVTNMASLVALYTDTNGTTKAAPDRLKTLVVGDSFNGGSAAISSSTDLPSAQIQLEYDISVASTSLGGTGHATDNGAFKRFSDATRTAVAVAMQPDVILIMGSVNDDDKTGIQAGAALTISNYKIAAPNAKIVLYGPQPTDYVNTLSANRRANNQAVKAAADAAGVVFRDLIGHAGTDTIPAFAAFTTYSAAQLISYLGSIWMHDKASSALYPGSYAPGSNSSSIIWKLLTTGYYGTGKVGATAGDGTRDTWVYSDNVGHPTAAACSVYADVMAADIY